MITCLPTSSSTIWRQIEACKHPKKTLCIPVLEYVSWLKRYWPELSDQKLRVNFPNGSYPDLVFIVTLGWLEA